MRGRKSTINNQPILQSHVRERSIFYDTIYIDFTSWSRNEELALRENNDRALRVFKERFRGRFKKKGESGIDS